MNRTFNFITVEGITVSKPFSIIPINYPITSGSKLVTADPLSYTTSPQTVDLVDNVYRIEDTNSKNHTNWYVTLSGSNQTASAHISSGSYYTGSVSSVYFDFVDSDKHPMAVKRVEIKTVDENTGFQDAFVVEDTLTKYTDGVGSLTLPLIQVPLSVTYIGPTNKRTPFEILPSGSACTASAVMISSVNVSKTITPTNRSNYAWTAQASDLRYAFNGGPNSPVESASYAKSASYALTASFALNGGGTITGVPETAKSASWVSASAFITTAQTASYVTASNVVGYVATASVAITASFASTASYITSSGIVGTITAFSASWASASLSASIASTASYVASSNIVGNVTAFSASWASASLTSLTATSASYAPPWSIDPFSNLNYSFGSVGIGTALPATSSVTTTGVGTNWAVSSTPNGNWSDVAYGNGRFVAVSQDSKAMWSEDGKTWTTGSTPTGTWVSVCFGNGVFAAIRGGNSEGATGIMTSTDGITWTLRNTGYKIFYSYNNSICFGNGMFVAVGKTMGGPWIITSTDGITWTDRVTNTNANITLRSVTYGPSGFVAVGCLATSFSWITTSPDGITWTQQAVTNAQSKNLWTVTYGNGKYVALTSNTFGYTLTSSNATNWWSASGAPAYGLPYLSYGNGVYVLTDIGKAQTTFMTSSDASSWGTATVASSNYYGGGDYGNNMFVIAGSGSVNLISGTASLAANTLEVAGNISCSAITASLFFGTASVATSASWARTASYTNGTSSYALTASVALIGGITSGATYAITSSWATSSFTSSLASTASILKNANAEIKEDGTISVIGFHNDADGNTYFDNDMHSSATITCGGTTITDNEISANTINIGGYNLSADADVVNVGGNLTVGGALQAGQVYNAPPTVTGVDVQVHTDSGNFNNYNEYALIFNVYAYKDTPLGRVYSDSVGYEYDESAVNQTYYLTLSWDAMEGADGYKIVIIQDDYNERFGDYYMETVGTSINYGDGSEDDVVEQSPIVVTPSQRGTGITVDGNGLFVGGSVNVTQDITASNTIKATTVKADAGRFYCNGVGPLQVWDSPSASSLRFFIDSEGRFSCCGPFAEIGIWDRFVNVTSDGQGPSSGQKYVWYNTDNILKLWAGSDLFYINSSGQVGMGTSPNAAYRCNVNGTLNATTVSGSSQIYSPTVNAGTQVNTKGLVAGISTKTAAYTLTTSDYTVVFSGSANLTASLPSATTNTGRIYNIKNTGGYTVWVSGSQMIDDLQKATLSNRYESVTIQSDGTQWLII